jgi:hypothetical protein
MRSQYLVVNFWQVYCGWMPELQQFYEKYRNDKSISIVTISNDKDLEELRSWMGKRKLTIPTLFDDGCAARSRRSTHSRRRGSSTRRQAAVHAVGNTGAWWTNGVR